MSSWQSLPGRRRRTLTVWRRAQDLCWSPRRCSRSSRTPTVCMDVHMQVPAQGPESSLPLSPSHPHHPSPTPPSTCPGSPHLPSSSPFPPLSLQVDKLTCWKDFSAPPPSPTQLPAQCPPRPPASSSLLTWAHGGVGISCAEMLGQSPPKGSDRFAPETGLPTGPYREVAGHLPE